MFADYEPLMQRLLWAFLSSAHKVCVGESQVPWDWLNVPSFPLNGGFIRLQMSRQHLQLLMVRMWTYRQYDHKTLLMATAQKP